MALAPPFTRENAGQYARLATIAREANRAALLSRARGFGQNQIGPVKEAQREVRRIVRLLHKCDPLSAEYDKLSALLARLWNKAWPTQGQIPHKAQRQRRTLDDLGARPIAPAPQPVVPSSPATVEKSITTPQDSVSR